MRLPPLLNTNTLCVVVLEQLTRVVELVISAKCHSAHFEG